LKLSNISSAVGLELDNGVIRAVELKCTRYSTLAAAIGQVNIPLGVVQEGVVADVKLVTEALKELWAKLDIKNNEVVIGVANQGLMMRVATLPKIAEDKLDKVLRFQLDEYFPIPQTDLICDFAVIGEIIGDSGPQLEILLVAIRKDMLYKTLEAVNMASLIPKVVEPSPLALMRVLPLEVAAQNLVLINIANDLVTLLLLDRGVPRFARMIPHKLNEHTAALNALETEQQVSSTTYDGLANDIASTITYYIAQSKSTLINKAVVCGQGSKIHELVQYLKVGLKLPVEVINQMLIQGGEVYSTQNSPEYAVSIGLALRGLENQNAKDQHKFTATGN